MRISDWSSDVCSSIWMFTVDSTLSADHRTRAYRITGEIFFASAERFADAFDFKEVLDHVVIDLSDAHFWDITGVGVLDKRSEEHTSELQSLMRTSYAVFCLKKKK